MKLSHTRVPHPLRRKGWCRKNPWKMSQCRNFPNHISLSGRAVCASVLWICPFLSFEWPKRYHEWLSIAVHSCCPWKRIALPQYDNAVWLLVWEPRKLTTKSRNEPWIEFAAVINRTT
jgi:hypothetical protein